MTYLSNITLLGVTFIIFYSITEIFKFYSIGRDVYGYYLMFYAFLVLSIMILPERPASTVL